ncbi:hypothetical protein POM88_042975 [Heracleum sosnowskyi]|uniref:Uncharacterized protein n=1 Tax=Heracleum sosnowskyi TaxID=360622 RepID=A0AAD8MC50_9APIA|nr:hypothetical protein POM88_042975 [Heracleum sosnowskyi]
MKRSNTRDISSFFTKKPTTENASQVQTSEENPIPEIKMSDIIDSNLLCFSSSGFLILAVGADQFHRPEIYEVRVKANSCTVEKCLELLKEIGREKRFIARSVGSARLFFAELNKEDADKLKGLDEICDVFPHDDRMYPLEDF